MSDLISEEETRNPQLFEMSDRDDGHDMMSAHIHYLIESWEDEGPPSKQWLIDLLNKYGT